MARKSGWQSFADNFNAVYGTYQKFAGDIESKNIMDEEVEILTADDGTQSWNYGGKTYKDEITPEMLRGLQYDRMATSMAKFGDRKGAMDMRLRSSELKANQRKNDLRDAQFDALVARVGLKNKNIESDTSYNSAQTKQLLALLPDKQRSLFLKNEGLEIDNKGNIIKVEIAEKTKENKIIASNLSVEQAQENLKKTGIGNLTDQLDFDERKALSESKVKRGIAQNKSQGAAAEVEYAANSTLVDYSKKLKAGSFKTPGSGKAWLLENWTGDPETAKRIKAVDEMQINQTLNEGAQLMTKFTNALTGRSMEESKALITQLIDDQDGIPNNVQIKTGDGGAMWLIETGEDGSVTTIAQGKNWNEFKQNLIGTITPMKSIEIATSNSKIANLEADTGLKKGQTKELEGKALRALDSKKADRRQAYMSSNAFYNLRTLNTLTEADILRSYERWVEGGATTPGVSNASGFTVERDD